MSVENTTAFTAELTANGTTTVFPWSFYAASADEIAVYRNGTIITTGFTVSRAADGTGSITFATAPTAGTKIRIASDPDFTQEVEFQQFGPFRPNAINAPLDRAAARDIWLRSQVSRAALVPFGETGVVFPSAAARANRFPVFDSAGGLTTSGGTGADAGLRGDLGQAGGGALVVTSSTRTVEDRANDVINLLDVIAETQGRALALKCSTGGIAPNNPSDDVSESIAEAVSRVYALPSGGELYIPPGRYLGDIDLSRTTQVFDKRVVIRGAGMGATTFYPSGSGSVMLNMIGVNQTQVEGFTLKAGDAYAASCGIFIARSVESPNANGNTFKDLNVFGNFTNHAIVSCSAETSRWINVTWQVTFSSGTASGFWTGTDPSKCGVTPSYDGTLTTGPNTSNVMFGCKSYITISGARHITVSQSGGWVVYGQEFIGGAINNQQMVRIESNNLTSAGGVFNGPVEFRDCHYEVFGTGNVGFFIAGLGIQYIYGLKVTGGYAVVDDNFVMVDFDRDQDLGGNGSYLIGSEFSIPEASPGLSAGLPLYIWALGDSRVWWRDRGGAGEVVLLAFAQRCHIDAANPAIGSLAQSTVVQWADAAPTTGTFARGQRVSRSYQTVAVSAGDWTELLSYALGTLGTLNSGSTTASVTNGSRDVTFSSATGLKVGQVLSIGGNTYRLANVATVGGIVYGKLSVPYIAATNAAVAVAYEATGFSTIGVVNMARAAPLADLGGGATLGDVITAFNTLLANRRAAGEQA
jgi:hypothetical protein